MRWGRRLALSALALGVIGFLGLRAWRAKDRGLVHRGWVLAESHGCFTCHGPGGHRGAPNPGHGLEDVPPWSGGLTAMYADSEAEIREWIQDGVTKRVRADPEQMKMRAGAAIAMPPYGDVLAESDIAALVAYVKAVSDFEKPEDAKAEAGRQVALQYGCFSCHGPQGRGAIDNPGSLKGYVPGFDGPDYLDLVRGEGEAREWILDGRPRRLRASRLARFFMDRQKVPMPAYRDHLTDAEVDALLAYIRWLRQHPY
ncbi:MAG TPA: c-type cytochrome [Vicinamibacteria bacterium]